LLGNKLGHDRELPTDAIDDWWVEANNAVHTHRDATELEKMMQEAPGQERPLPSLEATAALREALADAIEELSPEEQFIIERLLIEGLSLRHTGWMMSIPKTTLARIRDKVRERLMSKIVDYEHIRHWIEPNLN